MQRNALYSSSHGTHVHFWEDHSSIKFLKTFPLIMTIIAGISFSYSFSPPHSLFSLFHLLLEWIFFPLQPCVTPLLFSTTCVFFSVCLSVSHSDFNTLLLVSTLYLLTHHFFSSTVSGNTTIIVWFSFSKAVDHRWVFLKAIF